MAAIQAASDFSELPPDLQKRFRLACDGYSKLTALWNGDASGLLCTDDTASGYVLSLAGRLRKVGDFTAQDFGHLCWLWEYGQDPEKIDARRIARDWHHSPTPGIEEFDAVELEEEQDQAKRNLHWLRCKDAGASAFTQGGTPLVKGLMNAQSMTVIYGASGVGKTFLSLDLAFHIAAGLPWQGRRTLKGLVVYVAAEGGRGISNAWPRCKSTTVLKIRL